MQLWTASQKKGILMDFDYIYDQYEIDKEIDRLQVQYENYMEIDYDELLKDIDEL